MQFIRRLVGHLRYPALIAIAVGTLIGGGLGAKPTQAFASSYQYPCQPYGNPYYAFMQWVSGWGYHVGEDVCKGAGLGVYASGEGRVMYSARTPDSYRWGNLILIEHTNPDGAKVVSLYGHLGDNRQVAAGQTVAKGQLIGFVGPQGAQNGNWGPHLHFGIHVGAYGASVGTYASWVHGYETAGQLGWLRPSDWVRDRLAAYDSAPIIVNGNRNLTFNGQSQLTFQVRNTGTQTWRGEGNVNPVRLGTDAPKDRGSGFAKTGSGWLAPNRIRMTADTDPGEVATFTATFASNRHPGSYPECFSVVQEGVGWLSGGPICPVMVVNPPSYRAAWVKQLATSHSDPLRTDGATDLAGLKPGQKVNLKAILKNVGELDWEATGPNPVRLGTSRPLDRPSGFRTLNDSSIPASENWASVNRPSNLDGRYDAASNTITPDEIIAPGESGVFSFTITVPEGAGTYQEYFNPVVDGVGWMPDLGMWYGINLVAPGYHYSYANQGQDTATISRDVSSVNAKIQLKNTGRKSWPVGGNLRLGTDRSRDNLSPFYTSTGSGAWLAPNRLSSIDSNLTVPGKTTVDSGETAEFTFTITVPALPVGQHKLYTRPVMDGVGWLPEDYGIYLPVNVTVPPYDYQIRSKTYSTDINRLPQGATATANVTVRNTGRAVWSVGGSNPTRLGTFRPADRNSAFAAGPFAAIGNAWLSANRASAIDGRVTSHSPLRTVEATEIKPGETALFRLNLKANAAPGSYTEYFNVVTEGMAWHPDDRISIPVTVVPNTSGETLDLTEGSPSSGSTGGSPASTPTNTPSAAPSASPTPLAVADSWTAPGDTFATCQVTGSGSGCFKDATAHTAYSYWNYQATYQTSDLTDDSYNLKIDYGNAGAALPNGYNFKVLVRIDGGAPITVELPGTMKSFTLPNLALEGAHTIRLEWINDSYVPGQYDANLMIANVSLTP